MKRLPLALVCAAWVVACSSTPTVIPTKNMDRPTDMSFVCLQLQEDGAVSGVPMSSCHVRGQQDPATHVSGQRVLGTFAFIPNATRGEMAVADLDIGRLLDLAPAAPGYGMLPIGSDPESISASNDGCWIATANRTSCDFSLIDPSRLVLLAGTFDHGSVSPAPATGTGESARRITTIQTGTTHTRLHSSTGEIAFLPPEGETDPAGSTTCKGRPPSKAVATFPGCDMVAVLDLSFETRTATIRSAYYVRSGGFQDAGDEPVCPVECASSDSGQTDGASSSGSVESRDGGSNDGGVIDALAPQLGGAARLQALTVEPGGARIHVASLTDTAVTSFDLGAGRLANPSRFELSDKPAGVTRLRLGVDPYATSPLHDGAFLDENHKFLYAIANDDSIRVVDITGAAPIECDVNVLPTPASGGNPCVAVGTGRRRAFARGPGLTVPTFANPDLPPPLPRDIAFANLTPSDGDTNVHSLSGQFGFLLASNGQVYTVDTSTHSFREVRDVGKDAATALLLSIVPQRTPVAADQAFASTPSFGALQGPLIKPVSSDGVAASWFGFPDPSAMISRLWDVVWEGVLPQTYRESGMVRSQGSGVVTSSAGGLSDSGADFCSSGVRPGDVLMFAGCITDSDCQPDNEFSCQVPVSNARGLCLPKDNAKKEALTARPECARFMGSRLRYEIAKVDSTSLALNLKLDEVPKTTLNPCQTNKDCQPDADHGLLAGAAPDGGIAGAFECLEIRPQERRCVERCDQDSNCRPGNVCQLVPGLSPPYDSQQLCVEAPPLDTSCFPQPMTRYSVRAGNSYVVFGSSVPRVRDRRASADKSTCDVVDVGNSEIVNRISLSAPRCPDAFFVSGLNVTELSAFSLPPGGNPCLYTEPNPLDPKHPAVLAFFENPQIRFALTNLDQYAGDLLTLHFEFQYGFVPLTVAVPNYEILLTMPTRILSGPAMTPESPVRSNSSTTISYPYLYVIDQGRTALTLTRGQVLRINPRAGSSEIPTFDTAMSGSTPFQLQ